MKKNKKIIIFDAEPFCFGPISTTINLVTYLVEKTNICDEFELVLLGTGTSKQLANASKVFDRIYECNTTDQAELQNFADLVNDDAALYVSTTNPHSVTFLKNFKTKLYYIDTLFWMWGELRTDFHSVDKYFIQRFFNIDKQLVKYSGHLNCTQVVSPLISHRLRKGLEEDFILINLGGMDTVYHQTSKFYQVFVERLCKHPDLQHLTIIVAGGGRTIKELKYLYSRKNLLIDCFGKSEFEDLFTRCSKFISAPGLTSMNESYYLAKDAFFLPPQNYSQYLNLKYLRNNVYGLKSVSYEDLFEAKAIAEHLPEEDGIVLVKELSARLMNDNLAIKQLFHTIEDFLAAPKNKFELPEEISFTRSGVEDIGEEICKAVGC